MKKTATEELEHRQAAPLATPTDLKGTATKDISATMNAIPLLGITPS